jgi:hypothetical protein
MLFAAGRKKGREVQRGARCDSSYLDELLYEMTKFLVSKVESSVVQLELIFPS